MRAQLPIPWNTLYTVDFINEMTTDHVCHEGVLTFADLGVDPRPVRGPVKTLSKRRHLRPLSLHWLHPFLPCYV